MASPQCFELKRVRDMTNQFDKRKLLGTGGFSKVYLGEETLEDGSVQQFAVKVAREKVEPEVFQLEIDRVRRIPRHLNLVQFIGYCHERENSEDTSEEKEQIFIYQLAVHGSLHVHLADKETRKLLTLDARLRIAKGTAEAIAFLHKENLIHGDINPHNILLNEKMVGLLSDFGTLELRMQGFSSLAIRHNRVSSLGYADRDFLLSYSLEPACDVYSFGVVLLQLASGEPATLKEGICRLPLNTREGMQIFLAAWARAREKDMDMEVVRDPCLPYSSESSVRKLVDLGLRCVRQERDKRPNIFTVLEDLRSMSEDAPAATRDSLDKPADVGLCAESSSGPDKEDGMQAAGTGFTAATASEPWQRAGPDVPIARTKFSRSLYVDDNDTGTGVEETLQPSERDGAAASTSESLQGTVYPVFGIWDMSRDLRLTAAADGTVYCVVWDYLGTLIIKVWREGGWVQLCSRAAWLIFHLGKPSGIICAASGDGTVWIGSGDFLTEWKDGRIIGTLALQGHIGSMLALAVNSDNVLFSGGKDKVIRRWDNMVRRADLRGHAEPVTALAIAQNGLLWSGDAGSNVKGWKNGEPFIKFCTLQGSISGLAFDGSGTLWTASSESLTVKGWKGKRCVAVLDGHMDVVTGLAVAPDGTVWTGSRDATVQGHRWDGVAPPMCVVIYEGHKGGVTALAVGHDGTVWSGGRDKLIKGWRPPGQGVPPSSGAR